MPVTIYPPGTMQIATGMRPYQVDDTDSADTVDMNELGTWCVCIQSIGAIGGSDTPTFTAHIEESADGNTWDDIDGATFTPVTTANNLQAVTFLRTRRYVRHHRDVTGTSPTFVLSVLIAGVVRPSLYGGTV